MYLVPLQVLFQALLLAAISRSSHWRCSVKKGILKNFAKFTGKHLGQSLSFNKVAGLRLFYRTPHDDCF